jgi:Cell division protein FtsL.
VLRLNLALIAIVLASALGGVASQHKARKLFTDLEREQERMRQLEVEWGPAAAGAEHLGVAFAGREICP